GCPRMLANGSLLFNGHRAGIRSPAPAIGAGPSDWSPRVAVPAPVHGAADRRPFGGLRVLDLGVIVVGAEAARPLADPGAPAVRMENRTFPDGSRMAGMNASFASGHRNVESVGINLRHPEGATIFERLVRMSDVVLTNFKPGTLDSLGIGYDRLSALNPE